jgi:hypothetical protein
MHAGEPRIASLDFVARLAACWDFDGAQVFSVGGREHRALVALAGLPGELSELRWDELSGEQRYKLIFAARLAIEFGRQCAWVFGDGTGART